MNTEILRALRADAAAWWRHRALRRCGEIEEAQRLERATIRRDLGYLRKALNNPKAYVSCGGGGTILHLGLTTVSLYAPAERFLLAHMAVRLGVPLVDTRPIEDVIALANLPRVAINDRIDPEPWGHRKVSTVVPKISNALDLTRLKILQYHATYPERSIAFLGN